MVKYIDVYTILEVAEKARTERYLALFLPRAAEIGQGAIIDNKRLSRTLEHQSGAGGGLSALSVVPLEMAFTAGGQSGKGRNPEKILISVSAPNALNRLQSRSEDILLKGTDSTHRQILVAHRN